MVQISGTFFSHHCPCSIIFSLAPPRYAAPFLVHASGAVALKVAQVPSTDQDQVKVQGNQVKVKVERNQDQDTHLTRPCMGVGSAANHVAPHSHQLVEMGCTGWTGRTAGR